MRRKVEDELIKLAFGDIEPGQTGRAHRLLEEDAEAAKLFAGYSALKSSLRELKAPEHQLSTERLRERLLAEGLRRERPSGLSWRWSWAPLAVAASALVLTLNLNSRSSIPPAIASNPKLSAGVPESQSPIEWAPTRSNVEEIVRSSAAAAQPEGMRSSSRPAVSIARSQSRSRPAPASGASSAEPAFGLSPEELSSLAIDGALPAGAVALHDSAASEDPIVLIGSESDENTGAKRATEVSSPANVVVGG